MESYSKYKHVKNINDQTLEVLKQNDVDFWFVEDSVDFLTDSPGEQMIQLKVNVTMPKGTKTEAKRHAALHTGRALIALANAWGPCTFRDRAKSEIKAQTELLRCEAAAELRELLGDDKEP